MYFEILCRRKKEITKHKTCNGITRRIYFWFDGCCFFQFYSSLVFIIVRKFQRLWIETDILNKANEIKRHKKRREKEIRTLFCLIRNICNERRKNRTEITAPAEKSNRKRQERVLESEKNGICMQQHNKNKADSNGKKSGNSSKQTSEAWKPVNFIYMQARIKIRNEREREVGNRAWHRMNKYME